MAMINMELKLKWLVFIILLCINRIECRKEVFKTLDRLLATYDRRATPSYLYNNATAVDCEIFIRSFGFKDPSSMDYQVDLYLRQSWTDSRLSHMNISQPLDMNDLKLVKGIWKPEVYFPNAKEATFEYVTVPNLLVRISPSGSILYMLRLKLVFTCMMELSKFPLDTQICSMEVASFSKTIKELKLQWKTENPVLIYRGLRMPQFQITKVIPTTCQESYQIGSYSCLVVEFHMRRSIGYHLVQSYLPTMLFVVISWLSFWMDVDSLLARTSLGITTLLTVSSKSSALQGGVPPVSYVKAIDVWMGVCTAFVFCSLLELTLVNCLWRKQVLEFILKSTQMRSSTTTSFIGAVSYKKEELAALQNKESTSQRGPMELLAEVRSSNKSTSIGVRDSRWGIPVADEYKWMARRIDAYCRVLFPLAFVGFVVSYWTYYLI